jgi:hypothetical protein
MSLSDIVKLPLKLPVYTHQFCYLFGKHADLFRHALNTAAAGVTV